MAEYDQLAAEAEAAGSEIFWLGGVDQSEVLRLEELPGDLGQRLRLARQVGVDLHYCDVGDDVGDPA